MKVLIIKTSSMGDIIHTLPALTDAGKAFPSITFDWVVEENFSEIPTWHPLVKNTIPVALRRWRKHLFSYKTFLEWWGFRKKLRAQKYDLVIDAQGLLKSAFITWMSCGVSCGPNWKSAREHLASIFYTVKFPIERKQHAITRLRSLFSQALGYALPGSVPDYGIDRSQFQDQTSTAEKYLVFLHGTTWATKHWPENYWIELAKMANQHGFLVKLPWGTPTEKVRAEKIAASCERAEVLPRLELSGIAKVLASATAVVAVDTGLGHLTAALDVPAVSLYGPTQPALVGALGKSQVHLSTQFPCSPCLSRECTYRSSSFKLNPACFETLPPSLVWSAVEGLL